MTKRRAEIIRVAESAHEAEQEKYRESDAAARATRDALHRLRQADPEYAQRLVRDLACDLADDIPF